MLFMYLKYMANSSIFNFLILTYKYAVQDTEEKRCYFIFTVYFLGVLNFHNTTSLF